MNSVPPPPTASAPGPDPSPDRPGRGRRRWAGGLMGVIGFLLSPLSWWNDLFVNVPLALLVAWPISLVWPAAFTASFVAAYWLTNVIGLVLLQKGARQAATGQATPLNRRELAKDLLIALGYTLLIVALVRWHVLQPLPDYFPGRR